MSQQIQDPAPQRKARMTTIDDLNQAIDALVQRQRIRLYRDDTGREEWQTLPSLIEQLESSVMWNGSGDGGGAYGSRPVISTEVVSLIIDITSAVAEALHEHAGQQHREIGANLRALASLVTADQADDDLAEWWHDKIRAWASEARTALRLNPTRPAWARGVSCPNCAARTATTQRDQEQIQTPALAIIWSGPTDDRYHGDHEWKVRAVECRSCGASWFRGNDLDHLVDQMLAASRTKETLAG